jgi:lysozyme
MAKKKTGFARAIMVSVAGLCVLAAGFYYIRIRPAAPAFVYHEEFGIEIPVNYSIHGIDVSKHQDKIFWKAVKEMKVKDVKLDFVFIKATEGLGRVDEQYSRNWSQARKAGLYRGAYHFFIATKSGKAQALNFIEMVHLRPGDLPPVLDVEEAYGVPAADIRQRVADWLDLVEKTYKTRPVIYTNIIFYNTYLAGKFDAYPLWIAHYQEKQKPRIERSWSFWQYNESGLVSGINAYVDFNVFNGDTTAFKQLLIH